MENTQKRDTLIEDELRFQAEWAKDKTFEQDAPGDDDDANAGKFFATMAYPYMNGTLHAGHAFTWSKVEFMIGFERMRGKRTLFPQGYHCTGMPIKAAADKLAREIEMFGKSFENAPQQAKAEESDAVEVEAPGASAGPVSTANTTGKFSGTKSKAAAKSGNATYQFQIMQSLGIPTDQIHKFADPDHWLRVFPQQCEADLRSIGARVDWRRSMVTTPANPYYDAFVRWQMNQLKAMQKIKFGKRFTVYSPKDGQACLDHDRSAGEGVAVQEYVALKVRTLEWSDKAKQLVGERVPAGAAVYFIPATLRPETMYGQTCCFVSPSMSYGIYRAPREQGEDEFYLCSERSARNMAYQGILPWGEHTAVVTLPGSDLVGTLVEGPLSVYKEGIRILPMETINPGKGTGVVTCVPSDSPDDYATVVELGKKSAYYGIEKAWVDKEIIPIIQTPASNLIAKHLYETMNIKSPKDTKQLAEAKEVAYKQGFYQGVMLYGEFTGLSVQDAKPKVHQHLLDAKLAFNYAEPDGLVISRSADECVAAYLDQWYLSYGSTEKGGDGVWYEQTKGAVETGKVNCFSSEAKHAIEKALDWLGPWACSRSFGLGTKLPWDSTQLVESLSDSTVYMAYYTICHFLHGDIYGKTPGIASKPIAAGQMTDDVWDYIFCRTDTIKSDIPAGDLEAMRKEFTYWYPLDSRVSGKDLINNHLLFFLYHHNALFEQSNQPRSIRVNGHLMLNGEKMSKSTGNFLTLRDAVKKYGADATRIVLADAGDGIEDANLDESVANATILRVYELRKWCHETAHDEQLREGDMGLFDKMFLSELHSLVLQTTKHYEATSFKLALKTGFYDLIASRDWYRDIMKASGLAMHRGLVTRYIELQALLLAPIAPHFSEYLYRDVLNRKESIHSARCPKTEDTPEDPVMSSTLTYLRSVTSSITAAEGLQAKKLAKGKVTTYDPRQPKRLTIFWTDALPVWQEKCMDLVSQDHETKGVGSAVDVSEVAKRIDKKDMKKAMPFVHGLKKRLERGEDPAEVLQRRLPFDEAEILEQMIPSLKKTVSKLQHVNVVRVGNGAGGDDVPDIGKSATPGNPSFYFENALVVGS